jgi:hypothetical protein
MSELFFYTIPSRVGGNQCLKISHIRKGHNKLYRLSISKFIISFYTLSLKILAIKFDYKNYALQI